MIDTGHRHEDPASDQVTGVRKGSRLGEVLDEYLRALEAGNSPDRGAARAPISRRISESTSIATARPRLAPDEQRTP
jgi:hypothetical protein